MFNKVLEMFTSGINAVGAVLVNLFRNIVLIFYDDGFTFYGVVFIIILVLSIIIFTLSFLFNSIGLGGQDNDD